MSEALKSIGLFWIALILTYGLIAVVLTTVCWAIRRAARTKPAKGIAVRRENA
jgi:hypothetical protein